MNFQTNVNQNKSESENLPLKLRSFGIGYNQEPINRPKGMQCHQWIQCVKGRGEFIVSDQKFLITEGCGMFIMANTPHSYKPIDEEWKVNYVCFDGTACNEILDSLQLKETGVFKVVQYRLIEKSIYKLYDIYNIDNIYIYAQYSCALYELLINISRNICRIFSSESISKNTSIELVIQYLEENYMKPITLEEISQETNLSKEYLCALFKKHMKKTIIAYLQIIRIANARIFLLRYPHKTISEIGNLCGFDNTSYFCKTFKKLEGVTPQVFREKK